MRVLIAATGSHGDIHPFLGIGREMKRRGHDVFFFASPYFASIARETGLRFVPVGSVETYETVIRNPDLVRPGKGFKLVAHTIAQHLPEAYRLLDRAVLPGRSVIIGSTLSFATRLVQEKRGVPTVTAHLAPSMFRSTYVAPRMTDSNVFHWLPGPLKRVVMRLVDAAIVDPAFGSGLNRFRAELGLAPIQRVFHEWIHEAHLTLGLFPEWFAPPQPDWPTNVRLTGFPLHDRAEAAGLPDDVRAFLDAGHAPAIVFTAGTATTSETRFYQESVAACIAADLRGMLFTPFADQVPENLPPSVRRFDYAPFSQLLPRVAAIVHHGGIGTASQALAAGARQLIRPMAFDQFDNAWRLETLGVASSLSPRRYRAATVAERLSELLGSRAVDESCRRAAEKLAGDDAVSRTCDVILDELDASPSS